MGNLLVSTLFLKTILGMVVVPTILFSIYTGIYSNDTNAKEWWFCALKSIGYTTLAILIYWHYIKLDKIPVLDLFTFMLAAFEGGHNIVNSFGLSIVVIFKLIFVR